VHKRDLEGVTEATFQQEIGLRTTDNVKFRLPVARGYNRATVLVALADQAEAKRACEEGLLWRAQLYDCEPYWATLSPTQCYKCWKWGHIQRYCRKTALCPNCGTQAHGRGGKEGEAHCPTHNGLRPPQCPACGGKHSARDKECPARAQEAYAYRPRTFAQAAAASAQANGQGWALATATRTEEYNPGATRVLKRLRGRPTGVAVAARDPGQLRINLDFGGSSPSQGRCFSRKPTS